jgi:transposase
MDESRGSKPKGRKVYTEEFRRSVVEYLLAGDKPVVQVAREFGITAGMLRVWKLRYGPKTQSPDASVPKTPEELARENEQLRQELARVTTQRDILKKTILIVSEQSNRDIK